MYRPAPAPTRAARATNDGAAHAARPGRRTRARCRRVGKAPSSSAPLLDQRPEAPWTRDGAIPPPTGRRFGGERAVGPRPAQQQGVQRRRARRGPRTTARSRPRREGGWRRRHRGSGPRPRWRSIGPRPPAAAPRCAGPWPGRTTPPRHRAGLRGRPPHPRAGRRRAAAGHAGRPPSALGGRRPGPAAPAPGRWWRPGRAARAAPRRPAARPAARGRGTEPGRAARPAARRPRTGRCRCSRTAARSRTATPTRVSTDATRMARERMPPSTSFRAGTSKTSLRISRYVSRMIGNEP